MLTTDYLIYILPFVFALTLAIILTPLVKKIAWRFNVVDRPGGNRKVHSKPTSLLGGVVVFLSFLIVLLISWRIGWLDDGIITTSQLLGIILGGVILMTGGILDDKFKLKPWQSFLFPMAAAVVAVGLGIVIKYITNPFMAGTGPFDRALFYFDWVNLKVISFGAFFSWLWLLGMIYTTKFLDGLDGLVTGVGAIGAVVLFLVSLGWDVPMSGTSVLCLILAGSLLGFLIFNFHPAKIFLGEGGATLVGFILGSLAIISGGKIATALLIMGIPILDVVWTIFRRIFTGHHIYEADRKHLHFRLLDVGFSHRQAVLFLYLLTLIFGVSSLFLQSQDKVWALGILIMVMVVLASILVLIYKQKNRKLETGN